MAGKIRIRAKVSDGVAEIKTLMQHDMETGTRKDEKTGEVVPAHYITEVRCEHNGKVVVTAVAEKVAAALLKMGQSDDGKKVLAAIPMKKIGPAQLSDYRVLETMGLERFHVRNW